MIITCPHCQTKYQVSYEAIGSAGRKVQCAHCQQAWQQSALDGVDATNQDAFDAMTEDGLDEAVVAEEREVAAEVQRRIEAERALASSGAGKLDAATVRLRQKAFTDRQTAINADLPLARLRRSLRILGFVLLALVGATAYFGRVMVVEHFPDMAGVYEAVGLGVNVVGLEFSNVSSLRSLRDGKEILVVSAQIVGLMPQPVPVPPVVLTLIDSHGQPVYEWSTTPSVRDLMAGERTTLDTQLMLPPDDAVRVRLSFAGGQSAPVVAAGERLAGAAPAAAGTQQAAPAASLHTIPEHH